MLAVLLAANVGIWVLALAVFHGRPAWLGTALLAYLLGLRHAIDADHLVAIDNATRRLMHAGCGTRRVGLYFSLGHSTVVMLVTAAVALSSAALGHRLSALARFGGTFGCLASAGVLLLIAAANVRIALRLRRGWRQQTPLSATPSVGPGRWLRPLLMLVRREWHMYPLGLLFGLGFDTATEIALLGVAASQAVHGLPLLSVLLLPLLFTAGMSLVDSGDGLLMARAYGWAMAEPARKFRYDMSLTLVSAVAALLVAAVELASLAGTSGWSGDFVMRIEMHSGWFGAVITTVLLVLWVSLAWHQRRQPMKLRVGREEA